MRIYFLRHGETDWNVQKRMQGRTDIALNTNGVRQAMLWRPFFDRIQLAGVYSSSLSRAMETAQLATHRPPCIIDDLAERYYGEWEGQTWRDIAGQDPDFDSRWRRADSKPPGGESRLEMQARVYRAMDAIVASHEADAELLIVGHGGSGKAVLGYANKLSIEELFALPAIANVAMTLMTREGQSWKMSEAITPDEEVTPLR